MLLVISNKNVTIELTFMAYIYSSNKEGNKIDKKQTRYRADIKHNANYMSTPNSRKDVNKIINYSERYKHLYKFSRL